MTGLSVEDDRTDAIQRECEPREQLRPLTLPARLIGGVLRALDRGHVMSEPTVAADRSRINHHGGSRVLND